MNKGYLTNFCAAAVVGGSYLVDGEIGSIMRSSGLFALSGAITNQLAIHMLFERVPFLYGSGIILDRFEDLKLSIRELMMEQFFTSSKIEQFITSNKNELDISPIIETTDFTPAYDALVDTIMSSSFGGMLGMFGGEAIIAKLKEPFLDKLKASTIEIASSDSFKSSLELHLGSKSDDLIERIESIVDERLDELTPVMVKEMIHNIIKEHLGWLVVWGGVFGGLIGFVSYFII